ncbi:MAG TPA: hypothetical protein VFV81_03075, partial [Verrucomicrobiae bacterium]|nr:hypothetical protein [Verrucomicrobiae bacterium]
MDNLSPVPRPEGGYPLLAPMEYQDIAPKPKFRLRKFLSFLRRLWWVPVVTLVLCLGAAAAHFFFAPPEFVSTSSMWETEKLRLPEGASFSEDPETYFGTLSAVLKSATLRQLTLDRMRAAGTNGIVLDKDGNPLPVDIEVFAAQQAAVFRLQATSANPAFTSLYLNALMNAYLDYKKVVRKQVSGDTLASISAQIFQLETGMKSEQERLAQYEQSNNIIVLQQENQVAAAFLGKLKTQLADYQLQSKLLDAVALEKNSPLVLGTTNLTSPLFASLSGGNSSSSPVAASQSAYAQIESLKFQRRQLSKYLRPEHPKIVKLDQQIADAQNLIDTYTKQNEQDIVSARQALKIRIDSTRQSIDEWEKKVADASACMAQAESLKANLARNQSLYDRLVSLLQNVDITRNIDQETLAVLQPATGAVRSYRLLRSDLSTATVGGLALGFGIVLLVAVRDDRFSSVVEVTEKVGDNIVGQVPEIPELHSKTPLPLRGNDEQQHMYVEPYRNL